VPISGSQEYTAVSVFVKQLELLYSTIRILLMIPQVNNSVSVVLLIYVHK